MGMCFALIRNPKFKANVLRGGRFVYKSVTTDKHHLL